jgi:hypothetical protein
VLGSGPAYYLGTGRRISEGQGEGKANPMAKIDPGAAPYLTTLPEARGHTRGGVYHRHGLGSGLGDWFGKLFGPGRAKTPYGSPGPELGIPVREHPGVTDRLLHGMTPYGNFPLFS